MEDLRLELQTDGGTFSLRNISSDMNQQVRHGQEFCTYYLKGLSQLVQFHRNTLID